MFDAKEMDSAEDDVLEQIIALAEGRLGSALKGPEPEVEEISAEEVSADPMPTEEDPELEELMQAVYAKMGS